MQSNNWLNTWDQFRDVLYEQFKWKFDSEWQRDELVTFHQGNTQSVVDFLFKSQEVCLKTNDLSEAEKLDQFLSALIPNVRMQVERRGPEAFQEAAMYAERAHTILSRVSGLKFY